MLFDIKSLTKYLLEGAAVALAAFYIPRRSVDPKEIAMIAITAAAVFAILDMFSPVVASGARRGSGFGIGYNITSGVEGFDDTDSKESTSSEEEKAPSVDLPEATPEATEGPVGQDSGEGFASI